MKIIEKIKSLFHKKTLEEEIAGASDEELKNQIKALYGILKKTKNKLKKDDKKMKFIEKRFEEKTKNLFDEVNFFKIFDNNKKIKISKEKFDKIIKRLNNKGIKILEKFDNKEEIKVSSEEFDKIMEILKPINRFDEDNYETIIDYFNDGDHKKIIDDFNKSEEFFEDEDVKASFNNIYRYIGIDESSIKIDKAIYFIVTLKYELLRRKEGKGIGKREFNIYGRKVIFDGNIITLK